jgi:ribonuclease HII
MKLVCGIDEAGRGPVIGPMVIAGVTLKQRLCHRLAEIGVRDSKLCSRKEREGLYESILRIVENVHTVVISPAEIDAALFSATMNLNSLELRYQAAVIDALFPDRVVLDCPEVNTVAYAEKLRLLLANPSIEIIAENKADVNHPIVSAASIVAKVTRDREIERIKEGIGIDFGSGYPGDPKTRRFLGEAGPDHAHILRRSWKTYRTIADRDGQHDARP